MKIMNIGLCSLDSGLQTVQKLQLQSAVDLMENDYTLATWNQFNLDCKIKNLFIHLCILFKTMECNSILYNFDCHGQTYH